jgi:hypothetical protein
MTRIILALASIALVFSIACGGDDKKDGGILGGGSSSGNTNTKDPVAFAQAAVVTQFNVFGGSVDPQKLLDLYLPECTKGIKTSDITQTLTMVKAFFPDIAKLKVEDIDLAGPKVEKNGNDIKLTIGDINKVRVKSNGKFVNANEFMKSIGFTDPKDSPLEGFNEPLELREQDGRLYISNCDDLKDIASSGPSATATPSRSNPTATPQRSTGASPTPGRAATATIGRDIATPSRGNTPTAAPTASSSGAVVKTTPTSAQMYPAALQKEFMDDCTGAGAGQSVCRCMLDILAVRYNEAAYRELEKAISNGQRESELTAIVNACTR